MTHIFNTLTWMAAGISSIYPMLSPLFAPSSLTFAVFFITFQGELPQAKSFLNLCLFSLCPDKLLVVDPIGSLF